MVKDHPAYNEVESMLSESEKRQIREDMESGYKPRSHGDYVNELYDAFERVTVDAIRTIVEGIAQLTGLMDKWRTEPGFVAGCQAIINIETETLKDLRKDLKHDRGKRKEELSRVQG